MDVSVIMQLQFQQFFVDYVEVPQLQFIDSMVVFQLLHRDRDAQCKMCRRPSSFSWCSSWTRWTCPLLCCDRRAGLTVQKTVEVPQLQYFDRVVDVRAAVHRQGLTFL